MTKVRGEREQKVRQGPRVTSFLGGRLTSVGPPSGVDPAGKMRLRISKKKGQK